MAIDPLVCDVLRDPATQHLEACRYLRRGVVYDFTPAEVRDARTWIEHQAAIENYIRKYHRQPAECDDDIDAAA